MLVTKQFKRLTSRFPIVASTFRKHWQTTLSDYSALLYQQKKVSYETALEASFVEEWQKHGMEANVAAGLLEELKSRPVLQTSHHVTPTNGPTFLAYDLISLAGLAHDQTYLVAANSGVAFSNAAWSGALSFDSIPLEKLVQRNTPLFKRTRHAIRDRKTDGSSDSRISLIPSKQRDQLVFGSKISTQLPELTSQFTDSLRSLIYLPEAGQSYSTWACQTCSRIQQRVFNQKKILFFDINRVISNYLVKILSTQDDHPIVELLFSKKINDAFNNVFDNPSLFLGSHQGKKSMKVEKLAWRTNQAIGEKSGTKRFCRADLIGALQRETICPGILLQFLILRFINGIKCLGSFHQVEYIEDYRKRWDSMKLNWNLQLDEDEGISLTTGRLVKNNKACWPLDLAWHRLTVDGETLNRKSMSELWQPIVMQLAGD